MTTETRHTPGPWAVETINPGFLPVEVEDGSDFWPIVDPRTTFKIADVYTTVEDARLIAAAPEMVEELEHLIDMICNVDNRERLIVAADHARALLRRIE